MPNIVDLIRGAGKPIHGCELGPEGVNMRYTRDYVGKVESIMGEGIYYHLTNTVNFGHDRLIGTHLAERPWVPGDILQSLLLPYRHTAMGLMSAIRVPSGDYAGMQFSVKMYDVDMASHTWTIRNDADAELPKLLLDITVESYATVMFTGAIKPIDVVPGKQLGICLIVDAVPTKPEWPYMGASRHVRKHSEGPTVDVGVFAINGSPRMQAY